MDKPRCPGQELRSWKPEDICYVNCPHCETDPLINPIVSLVICPSSPLQLIGDACEVIIEAARHWLPVNILSMAGASAPISVSGKLVTHNAEVFGKR